MSVRTVVQSALEIQRREKLIGSSLEAKVRLLAEPVKYDLLKAYVTDLPTLFIVSQVVLERTPALPTEGHLLCSPSCGIAVDVDRAEGVKCERCWNYRASVGGSSTHPSLCDRCVEALR